MKTTHRAESRYLLYPLFIANDLIPWGALLAEPEYPSVQRFKNSPDVTRNRVRTYVFLSGWTAAPFDEVVLGEVSFDRSAAIVVETDVEKCFEDGNRERGAAEATGLEVFGACEVVVVELD